ncbi:MAG: S8 family serine peptidase, partial [Myxococcales bacterium]|nr:S8 family serine peptidase [Myxococcales bacterium]
GCVLVAASGNDGDRVRYFPAAAEGVIAVGSVGPSGAPSSFSSRGDHVVVSAPGEKIWSATLDDGYRHNTGTSFAAPFVTGACALLLARAARYGQPLSGEDLRELLRVTAKPFAAGLDHTGCGAGILDISAALAALEQVLATRSRSRLVRAPAHP